VSDYQCTVLLLAAGADMNKRDSVYRFETFVCAAFFLREHQCNVH
jgi:hypothetical protein